MSVLIIPNNKIYIPMLQSFIVESAKLAKFDEEFLSKLQLVSEEAFVYIITTSFEEDEKAEVKIKTDIENSYFRVAFFDEGLPFDASLSKEYKPEDFSTQALGFFLIKQYSDNVEWVNHGIKGKEFRLSFKLPSEDIFSIDKNQENLTKKDENREISFDDIEIRHFKESDAIKISRIIYRAYGYTYPNEDLYYPQKIIDLNKSGELISIVSYDKKTEEVIGHYSLERPGIGPVAESAQAVVSPKYRGFGLMEKMRNLIEKTAIELGLEGIISQPVTSHIFSQRVNERFGSSPCGFSFGFVPQKQSFKHIVQTLTQRESGMLYFKVLNQRQRNLYIPQKHKKIIDTIYKYIKLEYNEAPYKESLENGIVTSSYSAGWGSGVINVEKIGKDNFNQIKEALYKLLFSLKAEVVFLNIVLEDADIDELVSNIEKEKFFFAGIQPSMINGKDVIRFEYLNVEIDESKVQIYSDRAKEIFNYIVEEKRKVLI